MEGYAVTDVHGEGKVFVKGEYWNAFSDQPIGKDRKIRVLEVQGLRLKVEGLS